MRVLIVEDEEDVADVLSMAFAMQWREAEVRIAPDAETALDILAGFDADIIVLDIALPGMNGFELCRCIREFSDVPIIIVTAKGEERDIIRGLESGADDYVTKPFSHLELFARIRAVLRRASAVHCHTPMPVFRCGDLTIDFAARQVYVSGRRVRLTPTEYDLLYHLVRNAGRVLPHELLLTRVWGPEYRTESDYLKVFIHRLREKIEPNPAMPRYILTERGVGYKFVRLPAVE
jgi:two-component system KDP operon response regulator KdpE